MKQPELFGDEPEPTPRKPWHEVPAALFLSWSEARQLAYCGARDEDSALNALDDDWASFYSGRAASYRQASITP